MLLAVLAMAALRAMHPPGGAVALATVLSAQANHLPGLHYLMLPVASGSIALVVLGVAWNARHRSALSVPHQPPNPRHTAPKTRAPDRRFIPSPEVLAATLTRLRLGAATSASKTSPA